MMERDELLTRLREHADWHSSNSPAASCRISHVSAAAHLSQFHASGDVGTTQGWPRRIRPPTFHVNADSIRQRTCGSLSTALCKHCLRRIGLSAPPAHRCRATNSRVGILRDDRSSIRHETVDYETPKDCAGALTVYEFNDLRSNTLVRSALALDVDDTARLDMDASAYDCSRHSSGN